jgi:hypothetical protein
MRILPAHIVIHPSSKERVKLEKVGAKFAQLPNDGPVYFLTDNQLNQFMVMEEDTSPIVVNIEIMEHDTKWVLKGKNTYYKRMVIKELVGTWDPTTKEWSIPKYNISKEDLLDALSS